MNKGFWGKLKKPILALAPMADVTDPAFRKIIAKYGKPSVIFTEFVPCDGLCSKEGRSKLLVDLQYSAKEKPIVAQLFGSNPENFSKCARLVKKLGFDGMDINMGCPDKAICKQGSGAALIQNPELAKEIIKQAQKGAGKLPVSVKTRIGYGRENLKEWLENLIEAEPAAIIIHARTKKQMSKVPADWGLLGKAINQIKKENTNKDLPLFIGNGDVCSVDEATEKAKEHNLDGVMIGRGVFGNPWFFNNKKCNKISLPDKLKALAEHAKLYEKLVGGKKPFELMKKHIKAYVSGFGGAKELRMKLMECKNAKDIKQMVDSFLSKN